MGGSSALLTESIGALKKALKTALTSSVAHGGLLTNQRNSRAVNELVDAILSLLSVGLPKGGNGDPEVMLWWLVREWVLMQVNRDMATPADWTLLVAHGPTPAHDGRSHARLTYWMWSLLNAGIALDALSNFLDWSKTRPSRGTVVPAIALAEENRLMVSGYLIGLTGVKFELSLDALVNDATEPSPDDVEDDAKLLGANDETPTVKRAVATAPQAPVVTHVVTLSPARRSPASKPKSLIEGKEMDGSVSGEDGDGEDERAEEGSGGGGGDDDGDGDDDDDDGGGGGDDTLIGGKTTGAFAQVDDAANVKRIESEAVKHPPSLDSTPTKSMSMASFVFTLDSIDRPPTPPLSVLDDPIGLLATTPAAPFTGSSAPQPVPSSESVSSGSALPGSFWGPTRPPGTPKSPDSVNSLPMLLSSTGSGTPPAGSPGSLFSSTPPASSWLASSSSPTRGASLHTAETPPNNTVSPPSSSRPMLNISSTPSAPVVSPSLPSPEAIAASEAISSHFKAMSPVPPPTLLIGKPSQSSLGEPTKGVSQLVLEEKLDHPAKTAVPIRQDDSDGGNGTAPAAAAVQLRATNMITTIPKSKASVAPFCAGGCGTVLEQSSGALSALSRSQTGKEGRPRYCTYSDAWYCRGCHRGETAMIPARMLHEWDFLRHPVCHDAYTLLLETYSDPLYDITRQAPMLYKKRGEMQRARVLRTQLAMAAEFLKTCRDRSSHLRLFPRDRRHLLASAELYSVADLVGANNGGLMKFLQSVLAQVIPHITSKCALCGAKAFICEFCRKGPVVFPFQLTKTAQCQVCHTVAHRKCREEADAKGKPCPKCQRQASRSRANNNG